MSDTHKQLIAKLAEELGPATAQHLVSRLVEAAAKPNQVEGILLLLDELLESGDEAVDYRFRDQIERGYRSKYVWIQESLKHCLFAGPSGRARWFVHCCTSRGTRTHQIRRRSIPAQHAPADCRLWRAVEVRRQGFEPRTR